MNETTPLPGDFNQARVVLLITIGLTVLLYVVPWARALAYPFMLLSTLAHELGHGIAAVLCGGSFERFEMWPDGSGVAMSRIPDGRLRLAWVAAGGLIGPAIVAAFAFALGRTEEGARVALWGAAGFLFLAQIFVVRGFFAMFFVAVVALVSAGVAWKAPGELAQLWLVFLAVQLALSVFSRGDYLFTATAQTGAGPMPSDVAQMAQALFLPYWFWGFVCGGFSVAVLLFALKIFWK